MALLQICQRKLLKANHNYPVHNSILPELLQICQRKLLKANHNREYVYEDIGRDFVVTSQDSNLFVKSKKIWWDGMSLKVRGEICDFKNFKEFDKNYFAGFETGINFNDKYILNTDLLYDVTRKDYLLGIGLKIRFVK